MVVIGGGWAGCAAALTAEKAGADVTLLERTDMLRHRAGRRISATTAAILPPRMYRHGRRRPVYSYGSRCNSQNMDFPGHKHATLQYL
ncbi:MAG: FAD-dependent oxidoreductase [Phascolarctobacterium faecium]